MSDLVGTDRVGLALALATAAALGVIAGMLVAGMLAVAYPHAEVGPTVGVMICGDGQRECVHAVIPRRYVDEGTRA